MIAREVVRTHAWRVVPGAELYGGRYDGLRVDESVVDLPAGGCSPDRHGVVLILSDGSELRLGSYEVVKWLHPAERRAPA